MLLMFVYLLVNSFDLFIYARYLKVTVGEKKTKSETTILLIFTLAIFEAGINLLEKKYLNLITFVIVIWIFLLQYNATIKNRVIAVILYMGTAAVAEPIGYFLYIALISRYDKAGACNYYFSALFVELLRVGFVEAIYKVREKDNWKVFMFPKEIKYLLAGISICSLITCFLVIEIASEYIKMEVTILCMIVVFIILINNYLTLLLVGKYAELMSARQREGLLAQERVYKQEYYSEIEEYQKKIIQISHNMKNQLIGIYDTIDEGTGIIAKNKVKEIIDEIRDADNHIYTENVVLNSIIKAKVSKCEKENIAFHCEISVPKFVGLDIGDMGVIVGNLFDNAIEACENLKNNDRVISMQVKYNDGKLLVGIINNKIENIGKGIKTSKNDAYMHGYGIETVKMLVQKYKGAFTFKDKGNCFEVTIILNDLSRCENYASLANQNVTLLDSD